ncbi:MAG: TetR/AcrR family transcriptional regulator [Eubacteriales bacterium]|nr:TetR/AcrR family transcriptional regulator [Eubacteriales bacterium]
MTAFTRQAIIQSFVKLLNEKPLNKITVKNIVEDCGINRNSFYYHFADIPTLVEEILKTEVDRIMSEQRELDTLPECLEVALDFALKNKNAAMHLYHSGSRETFEQYLIRIASYCADVFVSDVAKGCQFYGQDRQIIINHYRNVIIGTTLAWMEDGMKPGLMDEMKRFCELFEGATLTAIARSAAKIS